MTVLPDLLPAVGGDAGVARWGADARGAAGSIVVPVSADAGRVGWTADARGVTGSIVAPVGGNAGARALECRCARRSQVALLQTCRSLVTQVVLAGAWMRGELPVALLQTCRSVATLALRAGVQMREARQVALLFKFPGHSSSLCPLLPDRHLEVMRGVNSATSRG